jgi:hypothetical protein
MKSKVLEDDSMSKKTRFDYYWTDNSNLRVTSEEGGGLIPLHGANIDDLIPLMTPDKVSLSEIPEEKKTFIQKYLVR